MLTLATTPAIAPVLPRFAIAPWADDDPLRPRPLASTATEADADARRFMDHQARRRQGEFLRAALSW